MRTPPRILIVDDQPMNVDILKTRLAVHGYELLTATDGAEALAIAGAQHPDLILLDIMMPRIDGIEVCKRLKADTSLPFMPIIMVTARADSKDIVAGLEAGADEYLTKPVDQAALVARVKSMLRIKALHDTAQEQAARLEEQATQLAEWNRTLEQRVAEQLRYTGAHGAPETLLLSPPGRTSRLLRRRETPGEPSARGDRGVLRPAGVHDLCEHHRARGGDGHPAGVPRRHGGADLPL